MSSKCTRILVVKCYKFAYKKEQLNLIKSPPPPTFWLLSNEKENIDWFMWTVLGAEVSLMETQFCTQVFMEVFQTVLGFGTSTQLFVNKETSWIKPRQASPVDDIPSTNHSGFGSNLVPN